MLAHRPLKSRLRCARAKKKKKTNILWCILLFQYANSVFKVKVSITFSNYIFWFFFLLFIPCFICRKSLNQFEASSTHHSHLSSALFCFLCFVSFTGFFFITTIVSSQITQFRRVGLLRDHYGLVVNFSELNLYRVT